MLDPETLDLMTDAFDAAWHEVELAGIGKIVDPTGLPTVMAVRILVAVRDGEHERVRLKALALEVIAKAY